MTKPRIHGIAKAINIKSGEIVELLEKYGVNSKNHMSTLEPNEIDIILDFYTQKFSVENFDFLLKKLSDDAIAEEEQRKKHVQLMEDLKEIDKPIVKKTHHVDTRISTVDLNKFDTQHIEELVPEGAQKAVESEKPSHVKPKKKPINNKYGKPAGKRPQDTRIPMHAQRQKPQHTPPPPKKVTHITIADEISVGELAKRLAVASTEVVKKLFTLGVMASVSQLLDFDTASLIAQDMGAAVTREIVLSKEEILFNDVEDTTEQLNERPPVVVVMGHVDHGKTKLLDSIRNTNVIATEAGGITQHIGACTVKIKDKSITFLDTPGHEAFTSMRARGAQVTDIAILVVAADDGIMPQTVEAINHAKEAGVSIIVAINKIDKDTANPDSVKQQLTEYGLVSEEWGGDTICIPVSALKGTNIDHLLEMVVLLSEMKELKANPNRAAKGAVLEARLDKGRGPVATVLVQNGTLHTGDILVAGTSVGRVRAMFNDKGEKVKIATPSTPVEIVGLGETPDSGDVFYAVTDEKKAREVVEIRKQKQKEELHKHTAAVTLADVFNKIKEGQIKSLNIIIKGDVHGSVEALRQSVEKLSNEEVRIRVIHGGVGAITESDIMLASASGAIIVGFNVRPDANTADAAARQNVELRLYSVIYDCIADVQAAMKGMLEPVFVDNVLGHVEVRQVFKVTGVGVIAGSYVQDGKVVRNSLIRVLRDGIVVHEGKLESLKRFKDDAKEVAAGYECGVGVERYNDISVGDVIESYERVEVER